MLAAQTERDQSNARLSDELTLKSALLEQAEANAAEAAKRAGLRCVRFVVVYPLQDIVLTPIRGQSCGRSWCWSRGSVTHGPVPLLPCLFNKYI